MTTLEAVRTGLPRTSAAPLDGAEGSAEQFLTFLLGGDLYAIGIMVVREIIEYAEVTPLPAMPVWIRGVINLRGAVVPVMDLATRFARPPLNVTRRTCIVVVELETDGQRREVGMMVDAVSAVLDIAAADIKPPPTTGDVRRNQFTRGVGNVGGRLVVILDADRALWDGELATSRTSKPSEDAP